MPAPTSDVCIPAATPFAPVVTNTGAPPVANAGSIESSQPIHVTAGKLRISAANPQASLLHDDLDLDPGAILENLNSLTIEGDLEWSAATIQGAGTTTIAAGGTTTATVPDSQRFLDTQTLRINGTGTFAGNDPDVNNDDTYLSNGAEIAIGSGGSLDLQGDQDIIDNGTSGPENLVHVESGGTLSRSTGSTPAYITTPLDNDGTVSAAAGRTLNLHGGSGTATSTGQFSAATGATTDFTSGIHATSGATVTGDGTVRVSGGATLSTAGATSVAAATTLRLDNGILGNTGTVTVNGTLEWVNFSTISGAGTTTIASGAALTATDVNTWRVLDAQTLRIDGTATLGGATGGDGFDTYMGQGAVLEVRSGGTLDLQNNQSIYHNGGADPLVHVLAGGNLTRSTGTGNASINVPFDNDATSSVTVQAGTLVLGGGSGTTTSTGQFNVATGAAIDFTGGTYATSGATFTGDGLVRIASATLNASDATSVAAATTLRLDNGTLSNTGTMTVNGTLEWVNFSTISGAGTTTIASGAALAATDVNTWRVLDAQTLRINGTATLGGATGGDSFDTYIGQGAVLEVGSGGTLDLQNNQNIYHNGGDDPLVHVLAGGNLTRSTGTGTASINVPVDNDATSSVTVQAGTLALAGGSGTATSTGQFNVATGAAIDFSGGTHQLGSAASLTGDGTVRLASGTLNTAGATSVAAATTLELD